MRVVLALSFDSIPVFTCFHEDKMSVPQSRNTYIERILKVMLGSLRPASGFTQYPHAFPEQYTLICRLQRARNSYQRTEIKLSLVCPGHFFPLSTWSSGEHEPLPYVILLVGQVYQPSSGSIQPWRMYILSAKAPQLQVCNATQCSADHRSHNSKTNTVLS